MKKLLTAVLMSLIPFAANAEWIGGVGYYNLSDDEGGLDVSLGVLAASIGYRYEADNNFVWMPEMRIGIGAGDDSVFGTKVEIDSLLAFSIRGQYDYDSGFYLFAAPSYARLDIKVSGFGTSASADDWEFGIGGGAGYKFSQTVAGELSYETFDGTDVIGAAVKFSFK